MYDNFDEQQVEALVYSFVDDSVMIPPHIPALGDADVPPGGV